MTVLAASRDLDWTGGGIVLGGLLLIAAAAYVDTWWATRKATPKRDLPIIVRGRSSDIVVHETCGHGDCARELCFCIRSTGACPGTFEPGCWHQRPPVCHEHRVELCNHCEIDARSGWGSVR